MTWSVGDVAYWTDGKAAVEVKLDCVEGIHAVIRPTGKWTFVGSGGARAVPCVVLQRTLCRTAGAALETVLWHTRADLRAARTAVEDLERDERDLLAALEGA